MACSVTLRATGHTRKCHLCQCRNIYKNRSPFTFDRFRFVFFKQSSWLGLVGGFLKVGLLVPSILSFCGKPWYVKRLLFIPPWIYYQLLLMICTNTVIMVCLMMFLGVTLLCVWRVRNNGILCWPPMATILLPVFVSITFSIALHTDVKLQVFYPFNRFCVPTYVVAHSFGVFFVTATEESPVPGSVSHQPWRHFSRMCENRRQKRRCL